MTIRNGHSLGYQNFQLGVPGPQGLDFVSQDAILIGDAPSSPLNLFCGMDTLDFEIAHLLLEFADVIFPSRTGCALIDGVACWRFGLHGGGGPDSHRSTITM